MRAKNSDNNLATVKKGKGNQYLATQNLQKRLYQLTTKKKSESSYLKMLEMLPVKVPVLVKQSPAITVLSCHIFIDCTRKKQDLSNETYLSFSFWFLRHIKKKNMCCKSVNFRDIIFINPRLFYLHTRYLLQIFTFLPDNLSTN